ncbi:hypothetical protein TMatcc_009028 [Talaromyces marneffei ATCC 18224]|uniref:C6 and C2H2 transcription factor, putative n=1 Tax=Talaromyces marneffei (strain ATCC 18224 / CBS 334.59 / QM 7333) TaxID=441960 RepID=B6QNR6_TALMQ|nr:C6 and C2H2 transcription factor, putative [Talaromyces marneffei ATCC 18224]KAE8550958.1 hypothetical protein EYB25_007190 [Talaromyces marneffei]
MMPLLAQMYEGKQNMSFQQPRPYKCSDPGCGASYLRREHLIRHEAQHSEAPAHVCKVCGLGFSRSDSLRRHERAHSKDSTAVVPRVSKACDRCHALKARCDKGNPCAICAKKGLQCTFDRSFKREGRSASILSGTNHEETQAGRKRRRVEQDLPDRLLGLYDLIGAVVASSSTPTPPPPAYTTSAPLKLHQKQSQAEEASIQSLRVAVQQQEAQIQYGLMNVSAQKQPPTQHPDHQEEDVDHPILRLSDVYTTSKSFLANENFSNELESEEMTNLMCDLDAKYYVELYFAHFHGQWPFLTKPQFNPEIEPPILVLAMVICGLRMTEEKTLMRLAWLIHAHLHAIFVTQMENWTVKEYSSHRWPIATYQAILLFTIFTITANDYEEVFGPDDYEDEETEDVHDRIYPIFTNLVDTCRVQRILHYPSMLSQIHADDPLVYKFTASEEFKYFAITLFKVDNILSKLIQLAKNDDDDKPQEYTALSISELQFPPPINSYVWEADGIRELLRRRARQCRDPSRSSDIYGAIMADDRETVLNRESNPWICDILGSADKESGALQRGKFGLGRKRRKDWMSLGPWLGYLVGLDVGSAAHV